MIEKKDFSRLEKALHKHEKWLTKLYTEGVVGVAVGSIATDISIIVYTNKMSKETRKRIEEKLDGLPVVFKETGVIKPCVG